MQETSSFSLPDFVIKQEEYDVLLLDGEHVLVNAYSLGGAIRAAEQVAKRKYWFTWKKHRPILALPTMK